LANFIADFTPGATEQYDLLEGWILNMDGSLNSTCASIKIVLTAPKGSIIEQAFTLSFLASSNKAEYEVVLAGLRMATTFRIR